MEGEAAIIIVDEDGELGVPIEACRDVGGNDDVPRGDECGYVCGGGDELGAEVALHLVLVDADVGGMDS
jgi:hypothetical protein